MTKFYIDCEFDGHGGPLLSLAVVSEDGTSGIHIRTTEDATDPWVIANVVPMMDSHNGCPSVVDIFAVGGIILTFIDEEQHPIIIADSPVDIGRFCEVISTDEHGEWVSADYPLMTFEVHNVVCYPTTLPGAVQHNAWWDAMALRHKLTAPA